MTRIKRFINWILSTPSEAEPPASRRYINGTERLLDGSTPNPNLAAPLAGEITMDARLTPKVDAFLREYEQLCLKHDFSLTHEDDGAFIVDQYEPAWQQMVMLAQITPRVEA